MPQRAGPGVRSSAIGGGVGNRSTPACGGAGASTAAVVEAGGGLGSITSWALSSFILPVRVVGVLQVPEGASAVDHRDRLEVVRRGGRGRRPLEGPAVPGV